MTQLQRDQREFVLNSGNFILGVTGSRGWINQPSVFGPLDRMHARHPGMQIRNGMATRGADRIVNGWCLIRGVAEIPHEADWDRWGRAAGPRRNGEMVRAGMDLLMVWALPCRDRRCTRTEVHPTHGTEDCVRQARSAGIRTVFSPQGLSVGYFETDEPL